MPPAARLTDMHVCPMVTPALVPVPHVGGPIISPGAPTVLIGGLPAARITDMCVCVGPPDIIVTGAFTVLICGLPAARIGDTTAHGGVIVTGMMNVLIGDSGGGSAYAGAGAPGAGVAGGSSARPGSAGSPMSEMPAKKVAEETVSGLLSSAPALAEPEKQAEALVEAAKVGAPFVERCSK